MCGALCLGACNKNFNHLQLNENVSMTEEHVSVKNDCKIERDEFGYCNSVTISVEVVGFSEQLTYFNASITVVFVATLVTDSAPSGENFTESVIVPLDKDGNGYIVRTVTLSACRAVNNKDFRISTYGTVTRIA